MLSRFALSLAFSISYSHLFLLFIICLPAAQIASIMTPNVAMVYDDENLMVAERQMIERGIRRLVVLRRFDNTVIGIISVDDIAVWASMARAGEVCLLPVHAT
jgi:predicted transcriptional regulator